MLVRSEELRCQQLHLQLQLLDLLGLRVVVPNRRVRYLGCLARVLER